MKVTKLTKRNTPATAFTVAPSAILPIVLQVVFFILQLLLGGSFLFPFPL